MLPQAVLIAWIMVSMSLFALMSPLRAFLLTYVVGILFLPVAYTHNQMVEGAIVFSQSVRIEKYVACHLGVILGTLFFAPQVLRRYRFHWVDVVFGVLAASHFVTSVVNGFGPKDGVSVSFEVMRDYLPMIVLTRLYLTSVSDVYQAMRAIIGGAFIYSAICVLEWRLSPQMHRWVYGYAQHDFLQQVRGEHFRAMGFLRHGIEVSTFMAGATVIAAWLWHKKLFKPLWGMIPVEAVLASVGIGLLSTMTLAGIGETLVALGLLGVFVFWRSRVLLVALPVVAILWMGARYTEALSEDLILRTASAFASPERVSSLEYRLTAESINLSAMDPGNVIFGKSPQSAVVLEKDGRYRAVDAWWLIEITFFGLVGVGCWYLIWGSSILELTMRWRRLTPDLQSIGALVAVLLGLQFIDFLFNSFPSMFLMMLNVGMVSALQHYVPVKRRVGVTGVPAGAMPAQGAEVALP